MRQFVKDAQFWTWYTVNSVSDAIIVNAATDRYFY